MKSSLCVVSSWLIKRVHTIFISNNISGSSNLEICFYHCWILTLIFHLKVLFNLFLLLLFIICIVNLLVVRPQFCRVIYYFDTLALGRRHQYFSRVNDDRIKYIRYWICEVDQRSNKASKILWINLCYTIILQ